MSNHKKYHLSYKSEKGCQGFTLIEVLVGIIISSLVSISLITATQLVSRHYQGMEDTHNQMLELETIRQFTIEECQTAETVSIYGMAVEQVGVGIRNTPIYLAYENHHEAGEQIIPEAMYDVTEMIFNANAINEDSECSESVISKIDDKLFFQGNQLASEVTVWQVTKRVNHLYMVVGIALEDGQTGHITYPLPIKNKEERDEAWVLAE